MCRIPAPPSQHILPINYFNIMRITKFYCLHFLCSLIPYLLKIKIWKLFAIFYVTEFIINWGFLFYEFSLLFFYYFMNWLFCDLLIANWTILRVEGTGCGKVCRKCLEVYFLLGYIRWCLVYNIWTIMLSIFSRSRVDLGEYDAKTPP